VVSVVSHHSKGVFGRLTEGAYGENDSACFAEDVVEDLRHGLLHWRGEDAGDVAHHETENDVEEPTGNVSEKHGHADRPWGFDGRIFDLFGDVCGCIVVGHSP